MTRLEQCVILVGGRGTRLDELTRSCPKPLLPVGGRPFLETLLWHLQRFGFSRVVLSAGYLADQVESFVETVKGRFRLEMTVATETHPLGTAGALKNVLPETDERFMLMNGDSVFDFNMLDLIPTMARMPEAAVAMALRRLDDASRFGVVDIDGCSVRGFRERGDTTGGLVNAGVYLIDRQKLTPHVPEQGSLERDVLPRLAREGLVCGRAYSGFFLDIGVPSAYAAAEQLIPQSLVRPAVFFDRDGVLNVDHGYVGTSDRFEWTPTAIEAVKFVNDLNWFAFLVTNQAGVARGYYNEADVETLHGEMQLALRRAGAHLDGIRFCPYHPEGVVSGYDRVSSWRKPEPGMILDLLAHYPVDKGHSLVIGDKPSDMEAARRAGLRGVLFEGADLRAKLDAFLGRPGGRC